VLPLDGLPLAGELLLEEFARSLETINPATKSAVLVSQLFFPTALMLACARIVWVARAAAL